MSTEASSSVTTLTGEASSLALNATGPEITVTDKNGDSLKLSHSTWKYMKTLVNMIDDLGDVVTQVPISLPNIDKSLLEDLVILTNLMNEHAGEPRLPPKEGSGSRILELWEEEFAAKYPIHQDKPNNMYWFLNGCDYLEFPEAMDIGGQHLCDRLNGCRYGDLDAARELVGIVSDFTPEEEEQNKAELACLEVE